MLKKDAQHIDYLLSAGLHQECIEVCQRLIKINPKEVLAWKLAGKALAALGQFQKAEHYLAKANEIDSNNPGIMKDLGNIYLKLGDNHRATQWYEKALIIDKQYAPAINNLAFIKRNSGEHLKAIELYRQVIQISPEMISAYAGIAASYLALNDYIQAELFAKKALIISKITPGINEILASIFQKKCNPQQAIQYYQKELIINSNSFNSLFNIGLLLLQQGQPADAIEPLKKAGEIKTSDQCFFILGISYQKLKRFNEAINEYQKINLNKSKNKLISFNLGLCFQSIGKNDAALKSFKMSIQLDDSFIEAWENIGVILMKDRRYEEALKATQKAIELNSGNPINHLNLGVIYREIGDLKLALSSTLKCLRIKPDDSSAYTNLSIIYHDLSDLDKSRFCLVKSLEINPSCPIANHYYGKILFLLGQPYEAIKYLELSLGLDASNQGAFFTLGHAYKQVGELTKGIAMIRRANGYVRLNFNGDSSVHT